jgi:hypothetical protein
VVVDARKEFDGADDGRCIGPGFRGFFDYARESAAEAAIAASEQTDGVGVAIQGGASGEAILGGDGRDAVPVEESLLDFGALGMAADAAFSGVIGKLGFALRRQRPAALRGRGLLGHLADSSCIRNSSCIHGNFSRAAEMRGFADGLSFDKASNQRSNTRVQKATVLWYRKKYRCG